MSPLGAVPCSSIQLPTATCQWLSGSPTSRRPSTQTKTTKPTASGQESAQVERNFCNATAPEHYSMIATALFISQWYARLRVSTVGIGFRAEDIFPVCFEDAFRQSGCVASLHGRRIG